MDSCSCCLVCAMNFQTFLGGAWALQMVLPLSFSKAARRAQQAQEDAAAAYLDVMQHAYCRQAVRLSGDACTACAGAWQLHHAAAGLVGMAAGGQLVRPYCSAGCVYGQPAAFPCCWQPAGARRLCSCEQHCWHGWPPQRSSSGAQRWPNGEHPPTPCALAALPRPLQVRTQTLVKNAIVQVDATPFRQWYQQHYGVELGLKKSAEAETAKEDVKVRLGQLKGGGLQGR